MGRISRNAQLDYVYEKAQGSYFAHYREPEGANSRTWAVWCAGEPEGSDTGYKNVDTEAEAKALVEQINDRKHPAFKAIVEAVVDEYRSIVDKIVLAQEVYRTTLDDAKTRGVGTRMRVRVEATNTGFPPIFAGDSGIIYVKYTGTLADIPNRFIPFTYKVEFFGPIREAGHPLPPPIRPIRTRKREHTKTQLSFDEAVQILQQSSVTICRYETSVDALLVTHEISQIDGSYSLTLGNRKKSVYAPRTCLRYCPLVWGSASQRLTYWCTPTNTLTYRKERSVMIHFRFHRGTLTDSLTTLMHGTPEQIQLALHNAGYSEIECHLHDGDPDIRMVPAWNKTYLVSGSGPGHIPSRPIGFSDGDISLDLTWTKHNTIYDPWTTIINGNQVLRTKTDWGNGQTYSVGERIPSHSSDKNIDGVYMTETGFLVVVKNRSIIAIEPPESGSICLKEKYGIMESDQSPPEPKPAMPTKHIFKHQLDQILTYLSWGMEWATSERERDSSHLYFTGCTEAVGHVLACWITQVCNANEGCRTCDGRGMLFQETGTPYPLAQAEENIRRYLKDADIKVING